MKILITGYTTRMFNSQHVQMDYCTFSYMLKAILQEMGHIVDHRKVLIGEELPYIYDYAFCGVAPLSSMTSGKVPETHWVMDTMQGRHAVYADDWSFCGFGDSVRYTLEKWDKYLQYKKFPYLPSILEKTKESLDLMMQMNGLGNAPVLCPMFPWGDHDFLMRGNYNARLVTVDPSAWVLYPDIDCKPVELKKRQWVMAALSDHSRWVNKQKFTLPVVYVGNKRMGDGWVLSEDGTVQLFSDSYGVLATEYPSAGSGWWRTRYLNAAWAETLLYAGHKDTYDMDNSYQLTPEECESMDVFEYNDIVERQKNWLMWNISEKEAVMETIERLIKK